MTDHTPRGRAHEPMTGTGMATTVTTRRRRWVLPTGVAAAGALVLALAGCQSAAGPQDGPSAPPSASPTVTASPTPTPTTSATDLSDPTSEACVYARGVLVGMIQEQWQPVVDLFTGPEDLRFQQLEASVVGVFSLEVLQAAELPEVAGTWQCLGAEGAIYDAAVDDLIDANLKDYYLEDYFPPVQRAVDALVASAETTTTAAPSPASQPEGLRETFDAMLAAMAADGEPGLVSFLANPSDGDLWGIASWAWTNPQCQDDAAPAEGAEGSCSATFTKDGAPLENIFTFTMSDGTWRLTDSWVWDENG
ncbi:hypothetical protein [Cellulomonas sp. Leaf395]|uniref:hypothetical protein n=1 Tax=Cellulomonas sp. Leaf395 TaxID=1736362 RepID=UPI0012F99E5F|nr:hypothetical protein [Cellulomonas sp. Leaf395]